MKFNTTSLTCTNNLNLFFLIHFKSYIPSEARLILKKPFSSQLTPWLKPVIKPSVLKAISFKETFKLLKPFNYYLKKKKKSLSPLFIRSNFNSIQPTLSCLKLSPSFYKTATLLNNLLFLYTQQFKLYQNYFYTYLQLISNSNLLNSTLSNQAVNPLLYKNLFIQNIITL